MKKTFTFDYYEFHSHLALARFKRTVENDIRDQFAIKSITWDSDQASNLTTTIELDEDAEEELCCLVNNLYGAS